MPKGIILFVDDELQYIEALFAVAEAEGYQVVTVRNASAAFQVIAGGGVDCVLMDIMIDPGSDMPEVDPHLAGLAAIDRIIKDPHHPPVICLSVISDQKIINSLKRKGVLYLRKGETSLNKAWQIIESKITGIYRGK